MEALEHSEGQLDSFDFAILRLMQCNNLMPQNQIGELVNLSTTAVHRRIKKMQSSGVIEKNTAIINPDRVGHPVTLFVEVSLNDVHFKATDEAKKIFLSIAQIQQCYHVTGDADFILIISLRSMTQYSELNRLLFETNGNIKGVKTFVSMDRVKTGQRLDL